MISVLGSMGYGVWGKELKMAPPVLAVCLMYRCSVYATVYRESEIAIVWGRPCASWSVASAVK